MTKARSISKNQDEIRGAMLLNPRYIREATHSISDTRNREVREQKNGKNTWYRHGEGGTNACGIYFTFVYRTHITPNSVHCTLLY